jgi:hypothetical protein
MDLAIYEENTGHYAHLAAIAALTNPNGASPQDPGLTNLQFVLVQGAADWELGGLFPPFAHYVVGTFGPAGINSVPTGFHFHFGRLEAVSTTGTNRDWVRAGGQRLPTLFSPDVPAVRGSTTVQSAM